uniref:Uncharacterized protein n=1 Tax=Solanum tuberosum TaxID=4113 RepID=M1AQZ4_SOLTU
MCIPCILEFERFIPTNEKDLFLHKERKFRRSEATGGKDSSGRVTDMSPHSMTLVSGFVVVIPVNVVIAFYICLAMREPSDKHEPDPKFIAEAKASVKQLGKNQDGDSLDSRTKQE